MERLLPIMKDLFKEKIDLKNDKAAFKITININGEIKGTFLYPDEIPIILKLYGGLKEDIQMKVNAIESEKRIDILFENLEDFTKVLSIMETIWDNAVDILGELLKGNYHVIKDVPNISD